jgi:pimeloyl-ACP methyl ester carboxylesterase
MRQVSPPVVFIHGLWLLPSWDRWAAVFDQAGYAALTPGWPDDPQTHEEATAHPEVFAHKTVGQVVDHYADVIGKLKKKPVVIGHSFGVRSRRSSPGAAFRLHRLRSTPRRSAACCRFRLRSAAVRVASARQSRQ